MSRTYAFIARTFKLWCIQLSPASGITLDHRIQMQAASLNQCHQQQRQRRKTKTKTRSISQLQRSLGSSTFVSIDPGLTDLAVGVRAELTWPRLRDGRVDMEARESMPHFGDDHHDDFSIASASWHDAAYHNSDRQVSLLLTREALDVESTATPTSKTARVALYLDHALLSLAAFPVLFEHYKAERTLQG